MRTRGSFHHGKMAVDILAFLAIGIIGFTAVVLILLPLFRADVQLGFREQICRSTVIIKNSLPEGADKYFYPICSSERFSLDKKVFEKARGEDDTLKQGGIRYTLDLMRRCKFMVGGDQKGVLFSDKHCYICYVLDTANDDVSYPLTISDFYSYALFTKTDKEDSYLRNLQSPGPADLPHEVSFPEQIIKNQHYALVYIDNIKPTQLVMWTKPVSGCVLSGTVAAKVPVVGTKIVPYACLGGAVAGGVTSLYDLFQENTNKLVLTELSNLKEDAQSQELGCTGYAY